MGKWKAQIQYNSSKVVVRLCFNSVHFYFGSCSPKEESVHAYDIAVNKYHGNNSVPIVYTNENGSSRDPYQISNMQTDSSIELEALLFN